MQVTISYYFTDSEQDKLDTVKRWFEDQGEEVSMEDATIRAEKEFNYYDIEPIENYGMHMAIEKATALHTHLGFDFKLTGVIDTSFTAGELMDFEIEFIGDNVSVMASDWYIDGWMESFEDYEDFNESFFECTEEEYNAIKDNEFVYILETDDGDVLSETVPLHEWKEIPRELFQPLLDLCEKFHEE